ncbi:MAG: diacylglycerol kinase [Planctomycetaceae bacterium]|nr:diacylglycerol kinase [Planctomycetaceae bacterium]
MNRPQLVIWNSSAGRAEAAAEIRRALEADPDVRIHGPDSAADAQRAVQQFCDDGGRCVVAAGGDGTINSVINGIPCDGSVELGVLPLGTANDCCESLAIPGNLQAAFDVLRAARTAPVDLAEASSDELTHRFANIATGGNSQRVTEAVEDEVKQRWGALAYVRTAAPMLADLRTYHVAISFDGEPPEPFDAWNVVVANGRTSAGRVRVAPRATLDDGLLDVIVIRAGAVGDLVELTARYFLEDYSQSDRVVYRQAKTVCVTSDPPVDFSMDGDLIEQQPASFRVLPGAVRAIVGPEYGAAAS